MGHWAGLSWGFRTLVYWERRGRPASPKSAKIAVVSHQRGNCRLLWLVTRPRGFALEGQDLNFAPYLPQCAQVCGKRVKKATSTLMHSASSG